MATTRFSGPVVSANGFTGPLVGAVQNNVDQLASGDGAITAKKGLVLITKGTAAALTLAAPTAGTDDGNILTILATTSAVHTVTNSSPGFNNGGTASDVATWTAGIGNNMILQAYNGIWYTLATRNVTLA